MCLSTLNLTLPRSFKFHSKDDGFGEFWLAGYSGIEPRFNETLYNEVLGITNDFLYPSNSKIYEKKKLQITKPLYSEQILPAPCAAGLSEPLPH